MKLFEKVKSENTDIPSAISSLLKTQFSIDISSEQIKKAVENMSLSDMLEIDTAITNNDLDELKELLDGENVQLEYEMPNRTNLQSSASNNPKPASKTTSSSAEIQKTDDNSENKDSDKSTSDNITSLNPSEYKDEKEINDAKQEIEKLKKVAGIK